MLQVLARRWWVLLLRGLCMIAAGVVAITYPQVTMLILMLLIGISALIDGASGVALGLGGGFDGRPWWGMIALGLVGVGVGIATLVWPGLTALVLITLVAVWSIGRGLMEIAAAVALRRLIDDEWLLALSGVLSVAFGVLILAQPRVGELVIALLIGVYLLAFGCVAVAFALRLRSLRRKLTSL